MIFRVARSRINVRGQREDKSDKFHCTCIFLFCSFNIVERTDYTVYTVMLVHTLYCIEFNPNL